MIRHSKGETAVADVADCRPSAPDRSTWHERWYLAIRRWRDRALTPIAILLVSLKVRPAAVSLLGVALALGFAWAFPQGSGWATAAFFGALGCDMIDGAVARRSGTCSPMGQRLDHLCDSATYAAMVTGALLAGAVEPGRALFSVWVSSAVLLLALLDRIDRTGSTADLAAGFWVHLPKVEFYVPLGLVLVGVEWGDGPPPIRRLLSFGLLLANLFAAGALTARVVPLLRKRHDPRAAQDSPRDLP